MRKMIAVAMIALLCSVTATADLNGKKIQLKSNDVRSVDVPLSIPCAEEVDGVITVREHKTGKEFPATLRNGELVFISEGAMPKTEHEYEVEVAPTPAEYAPKVLLKKHEDASIIDVEVLGVPLTAYHYSNDNMKPFLWPVLSEGGVGLTRDYPMKPEGTPKAFQDHIHHKSLWTSFGDLNGVDCWGEAENAGYQVSGEVTYGSGDAYGWVHAKNTWTDKDKKPVLSEEREYRFYATPEKRRMIDVFVTFSADTQDVKFGDTKEGGIVTVRMRPELCGRHAVIVNALGDEKERNCWGKPSPWCDYGGELKDVGFRGLTIFDHPTNLRYPSSWHVRTYGLMGANCFGYSYFSEKEHNKGLIPDNGDYLLKKGESLSFQYRVFIHTGDVKKARVANRYADYATPAVAWVD